MHSHSTEGTLNPTCKTMIITGAKVHIESVSTLPPQIRGDVRGFVQHNLPTYYSSRDVIHQLRNLQKTLPLVSLHLVVLSWPHTEADKLYTYYLRSLCWEGG